MAGGSNGYRAALVRRQLTPELISSLPGTAGLPPFISFLTSYPELDSGQDCGNRKQAAWIAPFRASRALSTACYSPSRPVPGCDGQQWGLVRRRR
jgi:hypothetical protein